MPMAFDTMSAAAERGDLERVMLFLQETPSGPDNIEALYLAACGGHLETVKALIPYGDPKANNSRPLGAAAQNGHAEVVKVLIPVSDPHAEESCALRDAAMEGHLDIVNLLIPVSDARAQNSEALQRAAKRGHLAVVNALIPVSDPKADQCEALRLAIEGGNIDVVAALIPVSDPTTDNSCMLSIAAENGHLDIVSILLPVSAKADIASGDALSQAIRTDHHEVADLLLPFLDAAGMNAKGSQPLQWAARNKNHEMFQKLVKVSNLDQAAEGLLKVNQWEACDDVVYEMTGAMRLAWLRRHAEILPRSAQKQQALDRQCRATLDNDPSTQRRRLRS